MININSYVSGNVSPPISIREYYMSKTEKCKKNEEGLFILLTLVF